MISFADPKLFCAHAVSAKADPDLAEGDHLRILASADLGPPLGPYAIWRASPPTDGVFLQVAGKGPVALPFASTALRRIVGVTAPLQTGAQTLAIQDDEGTELARDSKAPWELAAPVIQGVTTTGPAPLLLIAEEAKTFAEIASLSDPFLLPMPILGACAWYAGGTGADEAMKRVEAGAPKRLSALDRPKGPYSPITPAAEVARVEADRAGIDELIELLVRSGDTPPALRSRPFGVAEPGGDPAQSGEQPIAESLLLSTVDPGFARYAGAAITIPVLPQQERGTWMYWVVGLFAVAPDSFTEAIKVPGLDTVIHKTVISTKVAPEEQTLVARMLKLVDGLDQVVARAEKAGLVVRPMLTIAYSVRPPDYLPAPKPQLGAASWLPGEGGPSTAFRQNFRFPAAPFAATMAMSASVGGGPFSSRAEPVATGASPPATTRHHVMLVGRDQTGVAITSDAPVPAAPSPPIYRFALADLFGRYGKSAQIKVPAPPRPKPPPPQPMTEIVRAILPPDNTDPQSPGTLQVRVAVPAIEALAAGARPIAKLILTFEKASPTIDISGSPVDQSFELPALSPTASGNWPLTAQFVDDAGIVSAVTTLTISVVDARAPAAIKAAPGILWTSRPGPAPEVELDLSWPSNGADAFRAYLADARGLGIAGAATRAAVAFAGCDLQAKDGLPTGTKSRFRLLTDPPVKAAGGEARLTATLPRSLAGVSFLKIVPLSAQGVEADFDACDFVPVAVPSDRSPPPPRLTGTVAPDNASVHLTIEAVGMDLLALAAAEPGLFGPPPPSPPRPPEYRLRRASGLVNDPLYARILCTAALDTGLADDGNHIVPHAEHLDAVPPFVRCTWWAEARMPAERRLPPDVAEAPLANGLTTAFEAQRRDMPGAWSRLSAPFTTVPAPASAPAALAAQTVKVSVVNGTPFNFPIDDRTLTIAIADLPIAHPSAIGPYRLLIWVQWGDELPPPVVDLPIAAAPFSWTTKVKTSPKLTLLRIAVVDPLGRIGEPLDLSPPSADALEG